MRRGGRHDPARLRDILDCIHCIEQWRRSVQRQPDVVDMYRAAAIRELMIIGEAVGNLSAGFLAEHPEIPWGEIRGFRNHAVHRYWDTQWALVDAIIEHDLPALRAVVAPSAAPPVASDVVEQLRSAQPSQWRPGVRRRSTRSPMACAAWMPRAEAPCALPAGHAGPHRSR